MSAGNAKDLEKKMENRKHRVSQKLSASMESRFKEDRKGGKRVQTKTVDSKKVKVSRHVALPIAEEIRDLLKPHCEDGQCVIAGSIRRERSEVGDIEIVCNPKTELVNSGLFTTVAERTRGFIGAVWKVGEKVKGDPIQGKYFQRMHRSGISVDIFTANKTNWGYQLLIRTGPWTFSRDMMQEIKRAGYIPRNGYVYKLGAGNVPATIAIPTEEDVFKLVGMPYIHPIERILSNG